jgi:DNA-binding NarL/FixJ family response regulator
VGLVEDAESAATLLPDPDVRGWALLSQAASTAEVRAAVLAADAGLGSWPASWSRHLADPDTLAAAGLVVDEHEESDSPVTESLTERERDVLDLLATGLSNRRIGERLGISEHTVKFHVAAIYAKLGVSGRAAAVSKGMRRGLIKI